MMMCPCISCFNSCAPWQLICDGIYWLVCILSEVTMVILHSYKARSKSCMCGERGVCVVLLMCVPMCVTHANTSELYILWIFTTVELDPALGKIAGEGHLSAYSG